MLQDIDAPELSEDEQIAAIEAKMQQEMAQAMAREARIKAIADRIERMAHERVGQRQQLEEAWLDDLRCYYGRYDDETEKRLKDQNKSRVYVRKALSLSRHWIARLSDLLFPVDEDNWSIRPTPVPELANDLAQAEAGSEQAIAAQSVMDEAAKAAQAMANEMRDQMRQSGYNARARDCIEDAVKLGTGIMKGPVMGPKMKRWQPDESGGWGVKYMPDPAPKFMRVDPWAFFPDPTASRIEESASNIERHLPTEKELRSWARQGFNPDAIRRLLEHGPNNAMPAYIETVSMIVNGRASNVRDRFVVWEYHGPLTGEELRDVYVYMGQSAVFDALAQELTIDPLADIQVVMWICQGDILNFGLHPLDTKACVYSVWPFLRDDSSIFGWGVPRIVRDDVAALNGAWRMALDNGGLSTGPQVVINKSMVEPANGKWELTPHKIWYANGAAPSNVEAFQTFSIESRQTELLNIVTTADAMANDSAGLPPQIQGEPGTMQTTAASGIAMLLQNASVVFRHVVRNFDDDLTVPTITRLYEFNMQHSKDARIKGDMKVDARGSSELLVRELTAQNLSMIIDKYAGNPVTGALIKVPQAMRSMVRQMGIPADDIIKTDDEIAAEQAQQPAEAQPDPEMMKLELQRQIAEQDNATKRYVAEVERDTQMFRLAAEQNMQIEELRAMLAKEKMNLDSKERVMAAEVGFKDRQTRIEVATAGAGQPVDVPDGTRFTP